MIQFLRAKARTGRARSAGRPPLARLGEHFARHGLGQGGPARWASSRGRSRSTGRPPALAGRSPVARGAADFIPVSRMNQQGRAEATSLLPGASPLMWPRLGQALARCLRRSSSLGSRRSEPIERPFTKSPQSAVSLAIAAAPAGCQHARPGLAAGPLQTRARSEPELGRPSRGSP